MSTDKPLSDKPLSDKPIFDKTIDEWQDERARLNDIVLDGANLELKRFFSLDGQTYRPGALDAPTKELLGLVASLVLRCDDCILYHTIRCHEEGITKAQFGEACSVGLIVGGSIVIPHLRRAMARWAELEDGNPGHLPAP
jgi:AhpD family alkylhydroperoxidase